MVPRKGVSKICFTSLVDDVVMVAPDLLQPVGLTAVELLLGHEHRQALMVRVDRRSGPLHVATPFPKSGDQCEELLLPDGVACDSVGVLP
jgi:hypothetical protein